MAAKGHAHRPKAKNGNGTTPKLARLQPVNGGHSIESETGTEWNETHPWNAVFFGLQSSLKSGRVKSRGSNRSPNKYK